MKTISAYKAQPTCRDEPVESVRLEINYEFPESRTLKLCQQVHKENAKAVMEALSVLPQGTRHQLLILMLKEKECLFTIK